MKDTGTQDSDEQPFISGFVDNKGKTWLVDQEASVREIEEHTDVSYHKIDNGKDAVELEEIIKKLEKLERDFNCKENLVEAAKVLAELFVRYARHNTENVAAIVKPSGSVYISLGQLFVEIASLYLIYLDKLSFKLFGKESSNFFYDRFLEDFIALAALTNYGTRAYDMQSVLVSELNERIKQYSKFPFFGSDADQTDTQIYQLGINVAKIMGLQGRGHILKSTTSMYAAQIYVIKEFESLNQIIERVLLIDGAEKNR